MSRKFLYFRRDAQFVQRADFGRDQAAYRGRPATLRVDVHANSELIAERERQIHLMVLFKCRLLSRGHFAMTQPMNFFLFYHGIRRRSDFSMLPDSGSRM